MVEYVKFSPAEISYGKKNALHSEMEILTSIKHLSEYKKFRTQELMLKIDLRKKIEEANTAIAILEKSLPKTTFKEIQQQEEMEHQEIENALPHILEQKKRPSIEEELEEIRTKLQSLQ